MKASVILSIQTNFYIGPSPHTHSPGSRTHGHKHLAPIDEETLLKKEEPFYYYGNPIYKFEDLIKFVEFDVSRGKVPREKVTESVFDP